MPGTCSREEEEVAFASWHKELEQDCNANPCGWRREFAEARPDEGAPLDEAQYNYLTMPEGKLSRDMTKEDILAN